MAGTVGTYPYGRQHDMNDGSDPISYPEPLVTVDEGSLGMRLLWTLKRVLLQVYQDILNCTTSREYLERGGLYTEIATYYESSWVNKGDLSHMVLEPTYLSLTTSLWRLASEP